MVKVISSRTYDLLHRGHVDLFRRVKDLDDYLLIVGETSDNFHGRGELNVKNVVLKEVEAVKATGY